jgi:hypothetical protein
VSTDRIDELLTLTFGGFSGDGSTLALARKSCGPSLGKEGNLVVVEVDEGTFAETLGHCSHLAVADDTAREDELITGFSVKREEVRHPLHHGLSQSGLANLIETVQKEQSATGLEVGTQHVKYGSVTAEAAEIVADEIVEPDVRVA